MPGALAAASAAQSRLAERSWAWLPTAALLLLCFGCALCRGPSAAFRVTPIGVGRVALPPTANDLEQLLRGARRTTLWSRDGVESGVSLVDVDGIAFVVNGKSDGNAIGDSGTQVVAGLLGALLVEHPHSALVVGLGTGSWLAADPQIDRVDVAEIEPLP